MMGLIYLATNTRNGKIYVGQTWESLRARWARHTYKALRGVGRERTQCRHFYSALRKYSPSIFDVCAVATASTQNTLDNLEKVWIILLQATDRQYGYNLKSGGSAGRPSEESRRRNSATQRANPNSGTFKKGHISKGNPGRIPWNKGKSWDFETKTKISESKIGVPWSAKRRNAGNPKHTAVTKIKMRAIQKIAQVARRAVETHCLNGHLRSGENCRQRGDSRICLLCERARGRKSYWKHEQESKT